MTRENTDLLKVLSYAVTGGAIASSAAYYALESSLPSPLPPAIATLGFCCGASGVLAEMAQPSQPRRPRTTARIGGMSWSRNEFCSGWLITGVVGFGKSQFLDYLLHQLFRNEKNFGGVFIDEKGLYDTVLIPMAKHYKRSGHLKVFETRPMGATLDWEPKECYNVISDERVPENTYAEVIANAYKAQSGGGNDEKGFFRTQAIAHIGKAILLLRTIRACQAEAGIEERERITPALDLIFHILTNASSWDKMLKSVGILVEEPELGVDGQPTGNVVKYFSYEEIDSPALKELLSHFRDTYWGNEGKDQLAGVQGTIYNFLNYFTDPEVAAVFCRHNTVTFDAVDQGALFLIAMPQKFQIERRIVSALFKQIWYAHVLRRYDLRRLKPKLVLNLLVLFQDEGQRFLSKIDQNVEIIRAAEATTVICTQSQASTAEALGGKEHASPTTLNLRNRFILRAADQWCAEESARFIGQHVVKKVGRSVSKGIPTHSFDHEVRFWVEPHSIRQLPKFHGILVHPSGRWKVICFQPLTSEGAVPEWWSDFAPWQMNMLRRLGVNAESISVGIPNQRPSNS